MGIDTITTYYYRRVSIEQKVDRKEKIVNAEHNLVRADCHLPYYYLHYVRKII